MLTGERQFRVITCVVVCPNTLPLRRDWHCFLFHFLSFLFFSSSFTCRLWFFFFFPFSVPLTGQAVSSLPGLFIFLNFQVVLPCSDVPFSCCCCHHFSRVYHQPLAGILFYLFLKPAAGECNGSPHHNQFPPVKERRRKRAEQDGRERKKDCLSRQLVVSRADQTWISDRSWFSISFSSSRCWGTRQQTASVGLFLLLLLLCLFAVCVDYTHM